MHAGGHCIVYLQRRLEIRLKQRKYEDVPSRLSTFIPSALSPGSLQVNPFVNDLKSKSQNKKKNDKVHLRHLNIAEKQQFQKHPTNLTH